jgi:hypothetical protein
MADEPTFLDLPYHQRKLIVLNYGSPGLLPTIVGVGIGTALTRLALGVTSPWGWALSGVYVLYQAKRHGERQSLGILGVDEKVAATLAFPLGHPVKEVVYVGHPGGSNQYFQ